MFRTATLIAALAATAALAMPAQAQDVATRSEVHYADLNLASATGAQTLKERVARAARRVCFNDGEMSLAERAQSRACFTQAIARAMPQVELALANAGTRLAENGHVTVAAH